jgi:putative ABC transport system substrate-binding protein
LQALGCRENGDFVIGVRFTQANAAQAATQRMPIVFAGVSDPVGGGLMKSIAHPGGKLSGSPSSRRKSRQSGWTFSRNRPGPDAGE